MDDNVIEKLRCYCKEESEDESKYNDLAADMQAKGCFEAAGILHDISHDEHTHKEAIEHIIWMNSRT